jgi:hypothetical protein
MPHKKLPRNAPCPCGSGKQYKDCCWGKGFEWVEDDAGTVYRSTPMTPEVEDALNSFARRSSRSRAGAGAGRPPLLGPAAPQHLEAMMVEDMKAAGLDPAVIYAFEQTGLLVTEDNQHLIAETDLAAWDAAIQEYEEKHGMPNDGKAKGKARHPLGIIAFYGPDDKTTIKIAAAVFLREGAEPIMRCWVASDVTTNAKVQQELQEFFARHGVKQVAVSEGNMGCPHEEGLDFPHGEDCPFCPFWKGKRGSNRKE